jgi:hypothetical protein
VSVVCCQVEVSALGRLLVQRSPTDGCVVECDVETSRMRRSWPTGSFCAKNKQKPNIAFIYCSFRRIDGNGTVLSILEIPNSILWIGLL